MRLRTRLAIALSAGLLALGGVSAYAQIIEPRDFDWQDDDEKNYSCAAHGGFLTGGSDEFQQYEAFAACDLTDFTVECHLAPQISGRDDITLEESGDSARFIAKVTNGTKDYTYTWDDGTGEEEPPTTSAEQTDNYTVSYDNYPLPQSTSARDNGYPVSVTVSHAGDDAPVTAKCGTIYINGSDLTCNMQVNPTKGSAPLDIQFSGNASDKGDEAVIDNAELDWMWEVAPDDGSDPPVWDDQPMSQVYNGDYTFIESGDYIVRMRVRRNDAATDDEWCTKTEKIRVNDFECSIDSISPQPAPPGRTVLIQTSPIHPDPDSLSYGWNFGDEDTDENGLWGIEPEITYSYAENGTYTVTVTMVDNDDGECIAEKTHTINYCTTNDECEIEGDRPQPNCSYARCNPLTNQCLPYSNAPLATECCLTGEGDENGDCIEDGTPSSGTSSSSGGSGGTGSPGDAPSTTSDDDKGYCDAPVEPRTASLCQECLEDDHCTDESTYDCKTPACNNNTCEQDANNAGPGTECSTQNIEGERDGVCNENGVCLNPCNDDEECQPAEPLPQCRVAICEEGLCNANVPAQPGTECFLPTDGDTATGACNLTGVCEPSDGCVQATCENLFDYTSEGARSPNANCLRGQCFGNTNLLCLPQTQNEGGRCTTNILLTEPDGYCKSGTCAECLENSHCTEDSNPDDCYETTCKPDGENANTCIPNEPRSIGASCVIEDSDEAGTCQEDPNDEDARICQPEDCRETGYNPGTNACTPIECIQNIDDPEGAHIRKAVPKPGIVAPDPAPADGSDGICSQPVDGVSTCIPNRCDPPENDEYCGPYTDTRCIEETYECDPATGSCQQPDYSAEGSACDADPDTAGQQPGLCGGVGNLGKCLGICTDPPSHSTCEPKDCVVLGSCDVTTGKCTGTPKRSGTECRMDQTTNTYDGICDGTGSCVNHCDPPLYPETCSNDNPCIEVPACDKESGSCGEKTNKGDGTPCQMSSGANGTCHVPEGQSISQCREAVCLVEGERCWITDVDQSIGAPLPRYGICKEVVTATSPLGLSNETKLQCLPAACRDVTNEPNENVTNPPTETQRTCPGTSSAAMCKLKRCSSDYTTCDEVNAPAGDSCTINIGGTSYPGACDGNGACNAQCSFNNKKYDAGDIIQGVYPAQGDCRADTSNANRCSPDQAVDIICKTDEGSPYWEVTPYDAYNTSLRDFVATADQCNQTKCNAENKEQCMGYDFGYVCVPPIDGCGHPFCDDAGITCNDCVKADAYAYRPPDAGIGLPPTGVATPRDGETCVARYLNANACKTDDQQDGVCVASPADAPTSSTCEPCGNYGEKPCPPDNCNPGLAPLNGICACPNGQLWNPDTSRCTADCRENIIARL